MPIVAYSEGATNTNPRNVRKPASSNRMRALNGDVHGSYSFIVNTVSRSELSFLRSCEERCLKRQEAPAY